MGCWAVKGGAAPFYPPIVAALHYVRHLRARLFKQKQTTATRSVSCGMILVANIQHSFLQKRKAITSLKGFFAAKVLPFQGFNFV